MLVPENPLSAFDGLSRGTQELFRVSGAESRSHPTTTEGHEGDAVLIIVGVNRLSHSHFIVSEIGWTANRNQLSGFR